MRSLPTNVAESVSNIRWGFDCYLENFEEFTCSPNKAFGSGGPGREETAERIRRAVKRMDSKAEDKAIRDGMRVETSELWWNFPELQLLGDHFGRAALRNEGRGSPGITDPPSEVEALRLAKAMLAHVPGRTLLAGIPGADRLNREWESVALSSALAYQYLSAPSRPVLREYIRRSRSSREYFDALDLIWEELSSLGKATRPLIKWRQEVDSGKRRRPRRRPHRPATLTKLLSDLNIQVTIEILRRVGIPPEGSGGSGCDIVSRALATSQDKALHLSWDTVKGIWQANFWGKPFKAVVVKHSEAISPEQHEARLMGQRILVRIIVRAHMGRQTASLEAEQDGGEEE